VEPQPHLALPAAAVEAAENWVPAKPFAVIHPGTARPEKYWIPQRWAEVITHLRERHGLECAITGGADDFEHTHISKIQAALPVPVIDIAGKIDLLTFAAVIARARLCVSCDTGAVHLAAAFRKPQIALFGPTNPFHWRPRHECAVVISAARPEAPLTDFRPRMKGAPMDALSTEVVIRATDSLLAHRR
jgi:ADP-heptose:LPS heptosyltransferase